MKVSRGACGHWEKDKVLASILNIHINWLATGNGDMESRHQTSEPSAASHTISLQDEETKEVAKFYYRSPKRKRKITLDLLHKL